MQIIELAATINTEYTDLSLVSKFYAFIINRKCWKYDFLIAKDVLPEKNLLERAAITKIFEYSPLGREVEKQTDIAKYDNNK